MDNVLFLIIKFYIFFIFLFLLGRTFLLINTKIFGLNIKKESKVQGIDIDIFYPVFGIFFLGNFLYIFNYFFPLKSNFSYFIVVFILFNFIEPFDIKRLKGLFLTLPFYIVLLVSSYDINFHYDAGLYHLNNQLWILESNIIAGFSNIYGPFGVSSIYEYVSAFLWIDQSFMLLHFLNLIFIGFFYTFLFYNLIYNKNKSLFTGSVLLIFYSIFDNFGFSGGRNGFINIQSIGKQDLAIAVLFLVTGSLLLVSILKKSFKEEELVVYSILSLFIFQLKISGFAIAFIYFFYLYCFIKANKLSFFSAINKIRFYILLLLAWIAKSIVHTGCLIFPYEPSCFSSLEWVNREYLRNIENVTVNYSSSYFFGDSLLIWGKNYFSIPINATVFMNYLISLLGLFLFSKAFFKKTNEFEKNKVIIPLVIISILFYLRFGPDVRYLSGLMMLIVFCLGLDYDIKIKIPNMIFSALLLFSLLMVPKLQSYKSIDLTRNPSVLMPEESMKKLHGRLAPESGDQCWVNINCSSNLENYKINTSGYFKIVTLEK
tara:strand:+ start:13739 stop:15367 length:1629 start_codon:yes stop_codon:yes gene_type:complete